MELTTRPQVTKLRLNHSFYLSQKWNLEPAHQEPPDQQALAYGPDRPVAPRERDPATGQPRLRSPSPPRPGPALHSAQLLGALPLGLHGMLPHP